MLSSELKKKKLNLQNTYTHTKKNVKKKLLNFLQKNAVLFFFRLKKKKSNLV